MRQEVRSSCAHVGLSPSLARDAALPQRALGTALRHPTRLIPIAFLLVILLGTALLMLPQARADGHAAPFFTALFTATSAASLSGISVVDPASYWTLPGQAVILVLMQLGGLGILTGATLLGLLVTRRLRLSSRLMARAETQIIALGDVTAILRLVLAMTLGTEALAAAALCLRLRLGYGMEWGEAAWTGLFHAVSAYTNAGLSTYGDSLVRFGGDLCVTVPVMLAVLAGGIGVPVVHDLRRAPLEPQRWSLHTRITLLGSLGLLLSGWAGVLAYEWSNAATLAGLPLPERVHGALFHAVMTRSGGFNTVDVGAMRPETLLLSTALMLIGGGSASTAGGIRVTTFVLLGLAVWAEIRGSPDTNAFGRRVPETVLRQALTIALVAIAMVCAATLLLMSLTDHPAEKVLFEVVSALATVGLSAGVSASLPGAGLAVLVVLMFLGRVGTVTIATALALRHGRAAYRYPEERPIVG
ncbi:TrkH family potassium uptake protein [Roseomonas sp. NAR14]|uniref:TrkH family potassium uptake protein n=1 Tax=Roseomonas acroporae TaxID=2937791 RepID=A0A9X2BYR4_9PROT|nr:potassium transporter TrkG [Roseomonas acroporae]MCK8787214.1 TrkH family potassium uptake protein [Roseomonas acroporae]